MCQTVETPCIVESEDGEVMIECGGAAASLTPEVAHQFADDLHEHGDKALEQRASRKA